MTCQKIVIYLRVCVQIFIKIFPLQIFKKLLKRWLMHRKSFHILLILRCTANSDALYNMAKHRIPHTQGTAKSDTTPVFFGTRLVSKNNSCPYMPIVFHQKNSRFVLTSLHIYQLGNTTKYHLFYSFGP